ncbi:MAG: EamA-like transporter family protein, partial [Deltaproteobacteria bacterium]|nr:EamA-like transporter family protein [Deltaproteobacteria bacterium]
ATVDALSKYALKDSGEEVVAWASWGFATPFLLATLPFIEIPTLDLTFWIATILALPLELVAVLFYIRSIKISPLSLTIPFLALTPVFLIATSFFILGELPDSSGIAGIILIAVGAYLLNLNSSGKGFLAPLTAILRDKGSLLMIGVSFIYSITSNLGKIAVLHSSSLDRGCICHNGHGPFLGDKAGGGSLHDLCKEDEPDIQCSLWLAGL